MGICISYGLFIVRDPDSDPDSGPISVVAIWDSNQNQTLCSMKSSAK